MRGEEMNRKIMDESVDELAREMQERALDLRIIAALERAPDSDVAIPADFAARVAAKAPACRPVVAVTTTRYGRKVMWACLTVLLLMMIFAAKSAEHSVMAAAVQWILFVQFLALAVWLGVRQWRAN